VLGGEPGDGLLPEGGMSGDDGVSLSHAVPEIVVVGFEAGDLGVARVGDVPVVAERGEPLLEFAGEVLPGAGLAVFGVEAGAVDAGFSELALAFHEA
jgi:hypothetical protein